LKKVFLVFDILAILFTTKLVFCANFPITPRQYQAMLNVGIDVNWLNFNKFTIAYQKAHNKGINIALLFKKRGFSHVRIRIKNKLSYLYKKLNTNLLYELKNVINDCLKAKIIPILTYDALDFRKHPNMQTLNETLKWWKNLAKALKDYPYILSYDLIIETSGKIKKHNDLLNLFYKRTITALRKIDRNRIIFITPNHISNPYYLPKLYYPKHDRFLMIEWHFYAAGPSKTNKKKLWTTGSPYEKSLISKKIVFAYNWCKKRGLYDWVGAWMPTNYNKVNKNRMFYDSAPAGGYYSLKNEIKFASFISESLKKERIPYAVNADDKFFNIDTLKWYDSVKNVVDAIIYGNNKHTKDSLYN